MDNSAQAPSVKATCGSHTSALDSNAISSSTAPATLTGSASLVSSESPPSTPTRAAEETCTESLSVPVSYSTTCLPPSASVLAPAPTQVQTQGLVATGQKPSQNPRWATGDPFFDTMAGMDSKYDGQYHTGLLQDQCEQEATTSSTLVDQSPMVAESSSSSTLTNNNIGLDHWNRTREQWTMGRWHVVPSPNTNNPALKSIHPGNHGAIYRSLINDRKRLSKPIPLPLVIKVLVSGWKQDGVWPQSSPAQVSSAQVSSTQAPSVQSPAAQAPSAAQTPSTLESTPESASSAPLDAPSSQGINAFIPGFSSTHSQRIQKKS